MKHLIKPVVCLGLLFGVFFGTQSHAMVGEFKNQKGTCYVLKHNKLTTKNSCTANGFMGIGSGNSGYGVFGADFKIKNYGTVTVHHHATFDYDDNGDITNLVRTIKLNNKNAIIQYRDKKTLKMLSKADYEERSSVYHDTWNELGWDNADAPDWLDCYKNSTGLEMCYLQW